MVWVCNCFREKKRRNSYVLSIFICILGPWVWYKYPLKKGHNPVWFWNCVDHKYSRTVCRTSELCTALVMWAQKMQEERCRKPSAGLHLCSTSSWFYVVQGFPSACTVCGVQNLIPPVFKMDGAPVFCMYFRFTGLNWGLYLAGCVLCSSPDHRFDLATCRVFTFLYITNDILHDIH